METNNRNVSFIAPYKLFGMCGIWKCAEIGLTSPDNNKLFVTNYIVLMFSAIAKTKK